MMTLRQALQLLADEGLVGTRHGLGTYVAPRFAHDLGHLRSFASDLAAQGARVTTRLLDAAAVAPPEAVGARLGAPAQVLRLRRLRLVGGRPVILQASYLPVPLPGGLDPRDLAGPGDRGLYTELAERGLAVARATETITPVVLTAADAAATSAAPRAARPCSATGSASPPRATRSSTTTPCCPATASPSRPTAPPTRSRSATPWRRPDAAKCRSPVGR